MGGEAKGSAVWAIFTLLAKQTGQQFDPNDLTSEWGQQLEQNYSASEAKKGQQFGPHLLC